MDNEIFYLKIDLLACMINGVNNLVFQDQSLNISEYKTQLIRCYDSILELAGNSEILAKTKTELLNLDWS